MIIIVCYDVSTVTPEGRRRLRRVARACERVGQRVQMSVFECKTDAMQFEELERELLSIVNLDEDCLRLYRLNEPVKLNVREHGRVRAVDFDGPLVI